MMEDSISGFRVFKKYESVWKVLGLVVGLATCCAGESKQWTMDELTTSKVPHKMSSDIYRDPRKSDAFVGDIDLSLLEQDVYEKELEGEEAREHERELAKLLAKSAIELDTKGGTRQRRSKREKKSAICGGDVVQKKGTLLSSHYAITYPDSKECTWRITVPKNHRVILKFRSFQTNCSSDYLEIRDGHANTSGLLGSFCGDDIPKDILSCGNKMTVKFVSDQYTEKVGFAADFSSELDECKRDHGCEHEYINSTGGCKCECRTGYELHSNDKYCEGAFGGVIEKPIGTIVSPSFPSLYPPNKTCIWEIKAPPKHKIYLRFTDFDVENGTQECEYDSVNITSKNANDEDINLGVFCGSSLPSAMDTEYNYLRIEFRSDESIQKSGFGAFFITDIDECTTNSSGCQQICENKIGSYKCSCWYGYKLHENLHDCEDIDECATNNGGCQEICNNTIGNYFCSCRNGYELHENFLDCEDIDECATNNGGCQQICNNTIGSYLCSCRNGYELHENFRDCEVPCGGVIEETNGTIFSPLFPNLYPSDITCIWEIRAPKQYRIILNFTHFNVQGNCGRGKCKYDSVNITSKIADDEVIIHGVFCGSRLPPLITSEGNALRIQFISDNVVQKSGFSAFFFIDIDECAINNGGCQQICNDTIGSYLCSCRNGYELQENFRDCDVPCGGVIEETNGTISSPLFPDPYPKNKICIWEIISPPQYRIILNFTHFNVEGNYGRGKCEYDSVSITSKIADDEVRTHGVFCGSRLPPLITSEGNALRIQFSSEKFVQKSGFSAFFFIDPVNVVTDVTISGCAKCDLTRLAFHVFLLYLCLWH